MFATDRDLLALEPRLFHDIAWTAQTLVDSPSGGTINAVGDTLTITGVDLVALDVSAGAVVLAANTPLEVIARIGVTQLQVSRLRPRSDAAPLPAAPGSSLKVLITTFAPQISIVHDQILRSLGIEPGSTGGPDGAPNDPFAVTEASITNPASFTLAESLGALHLILASAAAMIGPASTLWVKAENYRDRFAAERRRIAAGIDLDGDGLPEATRRPNIIQFIRA